MASGAFFFENRVWFGQTAAAVNARVFEKRPFRNPHKRKKRQQQAKPESCTLQRRRPLEIIEVDALREFFCCACACHDSLGLVAQRHHRMHGAKQNQRERKRNVQQQPAVEPAVQSFLARELPRFVANIFEVAQRDMRRRG